ncbi:MAG: nucleotidyltransferase domain-containing protein [Planctomycetota bacterium]
MERAAILAALTSYFAGRADVFAAYLFGSVARDEAKASSDVDVAVLLRAGRPATLEAFDPVFEIQDDLGRILGREIDLVVMNGAPLDLLHRILRDGVLLLDREPIRRMEFELQARTEYFDFLPLLLRYRKMVLESA